jgi:hypothetical protein
VDPSIGDVFLGALTLNEDVFVALLHSGHAIRTSVVMLALVGLSWMLGHCAILFLNRVPPSGFVIRTLALAGSFLFGALLWVASTWLIGALFTGTPDARASIVVPLAAFAYAPLLLSVFILIPYVGSGVEAVLNTWTLLALVLGVMTVFEIGLARALACALVGWGLTHLLPRVAGGRLDPVFDNTWYRINSARLRAQGEVAAAESVGRLRGP